MNQEYINGPVRVMQTKSNNKQYINGPVRVMQTKGNNKPPNTETNIDFNRNTGVDGSPGWLPTKACKY